MIGVKTGCGQGISQNCCRFLEGNPMLLKIYSYFDRIPFNFHVSDYIIFNLGKKEKEEQAWNQLSVLVKKGMAKMNQTSKKS
jgi:hypothetical protein